MHISTPFSILVLWIFISHNINGQTSYTLSASDLGNDVEFLDAKPYEEGTVLYFHSTDSDGDTQLNLAYLDHQLNIQESIALSDVIPWFAYGDVADRYYVLTVLANGDVIIVGGQKSGRRIIEAIVRKTKNNETLWSTGFTDETKSVLNSYSIDNKLHLFMNQGHRHGIRWARRSIYNQSNADILLDTLHMGPEVDPLSGIISTTSDGNAVYSLGYKYENHETIHHLTTYNSDGVITFHKELGPETYYCPLLIELKTDLQSLYIVDHLIRQDTLGISLSEVSLDSFEEIRRFRVFLDTLPIISYEIVDDQLVVLSKTASGISANISSLISFENEVILFDVDHPQEKYDRIQKTKDHSLLLLYSSGNTEDLQEDQLVKIELEHSVTSSEEALDNSSKALTVTPNPVETEQRITLDHNLIGPGILHLRNIYGAPLLEIATEYIQELNTFALPDLPEGVYLLSLKTHNSVVSQWVCIQG